MKSSDTKYLHYNVTKVQKSGLKAKAWLWIHKCFANQIAYIVTLQQNTDALSEKSCLSRVSGYYGLRTTHNERSKRQRLTNANVMANI